MTSNGERPIIIEGEKVFLSGRMAPLIACAKREFRHFSWSSGVKAKRAKRNGWVSDIDTEHCTLVISIISGVRNTGKRDRGWSAWHGLGMVGLCVVC